VHEPVVTDVGENVLDSSHPLHGQILAVLDNRRVLADPRLFQLLQGVRVDPLQHRALLTLLAAIHAKLTDAVDVLLHVLDSLMLVGVRTVAPVLVGSEHGEEKVAVDVEKDLRDVLDLAAEDLFGD